MENKKTDIFDNLNDQLKYVQGTDEYTLPKAEEEDFSVEDSDSRIKLEHFLL